MSATPVDRRIRVTAPSRLHLGMFSFGRAEVRQFGGSGIMLDRPGLMLEARHGERLTVEGPHADRVERFARLAAAAMGLPGEPPCRLIVTAAPRQHVGLGTGTQLGLSTAAALAAFFGEERPPATELARRCGRGERSAVGTYGFDLGGLLIESGKRASGGVSPLAARVALPDAWRFVLISPREASGLSGPAERAAFERLPAVPSETTARLCELALLRLLPAALEDDIDAFGETMYEFGVVSGESFATFQSGAFATPRTAELVRTLRDWGIRGVGQSSWGPTLFALTPSSAAATELVARLQSDPASGELQYIIAAPNNRGATIDAP